MLWPWQGPPGLRAVWAAVLGPADTKAGGHTLLLQGRVQSGTIPGPGEATGVGPTSELCLQGEGCRADPPAPDVLTHCLPHCPGLWPGATWSCLPSSAGDNGGPALSPGVSPSPLSEASVPRAGCVLQLPVLTTAFQPLGSLGCTILRCACAPPPALVFLRGWPRASVQLSYPAFAGTRIL